jgi:hypothetical protein
MLPEIGFKNGRSHRVYKLQECARIVEWLEKTFGSAVNTVQADPYDFEISNKRYTGKGSEII